MTTLPFGTDITLAQAPQPAAGTTPTIVGVIGQAGSGATGAATNVAHLVHTKAEMLTLVGTDGELNRWAEEFYSREAGEVLVAIVAAFTANDDSDRNEKATAAVNLFAADYGATGVHASIIDIHDYGTQVESGSETAASPVIAALETVCEARRSTGFANFPAVATDALAAWSTNLNAWATANRKPRVNCCGGTVITAASSVADGGVAASTILTAKRAALDGEAGITEPLGNKPLTGIVTTWPVIPYALNRQAALTGRTIQNTYGVNFVANYRGWKTVRAELADTGNGYRRYESILRALDVAEDRYEAAIGNHLDGRNDGAEVALLQQDVSNVTAALITDRLITEAAFSLAVAETGDDAAAYRVRLTGSVTTVKPMVQVDLDIQVK